MITTTEWLHRIGQMKLGLLTDIHEHIEYLRTALDCFTRERVDQVIVIGDLLEMGERVDEICGWLADAAAVGVWDQWLLASPGGIDLWRGEGSVRLNPGRYFVVVGALCEGSYAIFDTKTADLMPFNEK